MAENSVNEIVKTLKEKISAVDVNKDALPEKFAAQFIIDDSGTFYIEIENGKINVDMGSHNDSDLIIKTSADTMKKLINRELSIEKALFTRKINVNGNLQKAMFIKKLFK